MTPFPALGRERRVVLQKRPDLRRGSQNILEFARHHADNGIAVIVERDLSPYNRWIAAEAPPPHRVAEDHHVAAMEPVVSSSEVPSKRRRRAQRAEVARAHELSIESLRLSRSGHRRLP